MQTHTPRFAPIGLIIAMGLAACGGGDAPASSDSGSASATSAASSVAAAGSTAPGGSDSPADAPDVSQVDWATVDVTTIDWGTIDLSMVGWQALQENPTAANLDADTVALIQSRLNPGSATLTIGDQTWEFDNFLCAFGHDATESSTYSFSTNSSGQAGDARTQMQVTIEDPSSQGRLEGADVVQRISYDDVTNFDQPTIDWSLRGTDVVQIDGNAVSVEGTFDDGLTPGQQEAIPGTLEATCGDQSRR